MHSVITILRGVSDARSGNATRHELLDVLTIALAASICGCETCVEFADFGEDREDLFREFLSLKNGLPSHDTVSRLFRLLDPAALWACFSRVLDELGADGAGVIAIDGKTLRRSFDRAAGRSALHVVTAFAADARLVLGQKAVAGEGNEITAARELLGLIDCRGALVTADAIHCNAPTALKDVKDDLADPAAVVAERHETVDADHGRVEMRRHGVIHEVDWLFAGRPDKDHPAMPGLKSIALVGAIVERDGKTIRSTRYYLSSARLSAETFARAARTHWGIENRLHRVLDTAFDEDQNRARKDNAAENLATIRKIALNVLKTARPDISIRRKRKRFGWSDAFARTVIGQMR
ncbi:MAG: ISAs1 family transposase [Hyphomicrobiales bacterium]|nr:ISAs1 family transposase [Hyphomicrobiales bacterium]